MADEDSTTVLLVIGVLGFFGFLGFIAYLVWMQKQSTPQHMTTSEPLYMSREEIKKVRETWK